MAQFRKKPVIIEAVQHFSDRGQRTNEWPLWLVEAINSGVIFARGEQTVIKTLEGEHIASEGDWIIQGVKGELYPCKPDIFAATYDAALTPRHEAPAEGAGVARDRLIEVLKRMDDGVYASLNDRADAVISALILQPKDPAEVGAEVASAARALLDACYKADENSDLSDFVDGMLLTRLDKALLARSSAPEARGEALGNLLAVIHGDGGHRALEVGVEQAAAEAEKIVAGLFADPSADKLRIALEALEEARENLIQCGDHFGAGQCADAVSLISTPDALKGDA